MTDRVTNPQPGTGSKRPSTIQVDKSKAAKRAAAKAAKARAVAAEKRRRMLSIVGAAAAVLVLIVGITLWVRSGDSSPRDNTSTGSTTSGAATQGTDAQTAPAQGDTAPPAAFPPVPAGADPALSTKPAAKAGTGTVSKLVVTTLIEGKGAPAQAGQNITVNYVGVTYADGKEFDSSWKRSQPLDFQLGTGMVIKGWDEGLVGVKVGSRVQLDIPASMAYGDNPGNGAPGGTLRFVVDLLAAK
ncbi:FKBP-type peptidyl-prolyl cis-trans isomerase [Dactylosporangium aurantiacum]|uniref:FKBP-type peptidyl-prolyl cis-trans isomerase n=1 Tax=Dactylosporangium aurantiacum TaxID=35754 RepID=UPI001FE10325|nr:FKBP-type peptidyl-prolyl cis-trans isomerase [Dactylosporangium aurantiacum]MDG6103728.1 FKBP-type peptidyl-prolyl cis-trans isomerase [Dactylosporangium aurantiacum]